MFLWMRIKASPSRRLVCQDLCICCTWNLRFHGNTIVNIFSQPDVLILCECTDARCCPCIFEGEVSKRAYTFVDDSGHTKRRQVSSYQHLVSECPHYNKIRYRFVLRFICKFTCYNHKYSRVWQLFILWFPSLCRVRIFFVRQNFQSWHFHLLYASSYCSSLQVVERVNLVGK